MVTSVIGERSTRDALIFIRPILLLYCTMSYGLFEPLSQAPIVYILFAAAAAYSVARYIIDVRRLDSVRCLWSVWLTCDTAFTTALVLGTGGLSSRFLIVFIGVISLYALEFGLKAGTISAVVASCALAIVSVTNLTLSPRVIMFCSFLLVLAWFTGSLSDDERSVRRQLANLAATDDLTGLFNQRHLYQHLGLETTRAEQTGNELSLLALDIDFFKGVNDRHGHLAGDDVLKQIAAIMRASVRAQDTVFRFGGEEFVVILPGADTDSAVTIGERIRTAISANEFFLDNGETVCGITISAGVVTFPTHASSSRELLQWADSALYSAKKQGKDQVRVLPFMVPDPPSQTEYQA